MEYGLTDDGYTAPRAADFLTVIRSAYEEETGLTIDWSADTFLGVSTSIMATQLGDLGEATQALHDGFDVNGASGLQLDNLALLVGVTRNAATYSTATVTLTGTTGTIIPEGSLVEGGGSDGKARWATTEDVTLAGGTGSVVVQAEDVGEVVADALEIDAIVTPVSGWTAVSNTDPATTGEARESDAALRKRRQQSIQVAGSRSLNALRANLLAVDGVQAAVVVDNPTTATATVEGLSLTAHSIGVVVYPSTLTTAQKEAVAQAIYDHLAAGIATNGTDVVATVTGLDGYAKTIRYDYAGTTTVNVATTVTLAAGYELADVEEPIQELIADYFLALTVGDAARRLALFALVATIDGVEAAAMTLNGVASDVEADATTLLVLGTNTVA
jgi:uncharacterized phage protein gp47/JayE